MVLGWIEKRSAVVLGKRKFGYGLAAFLVVLGGQVAAGQTPTSVPVPVKDAPVPAVTLASPTALSVKAAPVSVSEEEEEKAPAKDGASQGIKIHGHWVIDVRNPDGQLAQHRDFQNSLVDSGLDLAYILAGRWTAGEWLIQTPITSDSICGSTNGCALSQYANGMFRYNLGYACNGNSYVCFSGLTVTVVSTPKTGGGASYSLVLSGQITATTTGAISSVVTNIINCATSPGTGLSTTTPANCGPRTNPVTGLTPGLDPIVNNYPEFTFAKLTPAIAVTAGQTVAFTVTYTFS